MQCTTLVIGASETLAVNFPGYPPNFWEHSVYADPRPVPAPNAVDAQRVTGLPKMTINENESTYYIICLIYIGQHLEKHIKEETTLFILYRLKKAASMTKSMPRHTTTKNFKNRMGDWLSRQQQAILQKQLLSYNIIKSTACHNTLKECNLLYARLHLFPFRLCIQKLST